MPLNFNRIIVPLFLVAAAQAQAQERPPINASVGYPVRFLCGTSSESFQEGVVRGHHATSISLHNPSRTRAVSFTKQVARALPFQRSDHGSDLVVDTLPPRAAIDIECNEIRMLLPVSMSAQFRAGFLDIQATGELDVVVIYTSRPREGDVSTIDMEHVAGKERKDETPPDSDLADLVPQIDMNTLESRCPNGAGSCTARVLVRISNIGMAPSEPSKLTTVFDPRQSVSVSTPIPMLAPGASFDADVFADTGNGCFDPDCRVCATADSGDEIAESNEANNAVCEERQG